MKRIHGSTGWFLCVLLFLPLTAPAQDILVAPFTGWQTENREELTALAFSGDGKLLLAGDDDGAIQCWNIEGKRSIGKASMRSSILFLGFLSGDRSFVAVDGGGTVGIFDLLQGTAGTTFRAKARPVKIALDAGKQFLAMATQDEEIEIFDLKALLPYGTIDAHDKIGDLLFLGFDRLGQQLLAITKLAQVVSWSPTTLKQLREVSLSGGELHGSRNIIHSASTNRAANVFVVGLEEVALPKGGLRGMARPGDLVRENTALAYDWNTGIEVKRIKTQQTITAMALGPGNDHIATISEDGNEITLVDLRKGELGSTVRMSERPKVLAISEDNTWMAAGADDGNITTWKLQFRGEASVATSSLPSLAGRIRSTSGTDPALKRGMSVRVAILSFEAKGMPQEVADIGLNSLSNSLANFEYVTLIERKQIESVIKEQQFQMSDLTDEKTSVQVGKLLNADNVLLCSIGKLGSTMVLTARLLNVETGKVTAGREVICEECRDQDIFDAIKMLSSTIAQ